jgi:transposase
MGKIRRRFDNQFKTRICEAVRSGMMTVSESCREYQLSRTVVDRWLAAYDEGRLESRPNTRERELERENERLKAKVGELTMQIDILKKIEDWQRRERSVGSSIITAENLVQFRKPAPLPAFPSRPTTTEAKKTK